MKELIEKVAGILEEFRNKRDKDGLDYNVFTLLDIERDELTTHEYMIFTILNYKTNPALRGELIKQFLITMRLPKRFLNEKWIVEKEHFTEDNGRIDLFFKTSGHSKKCVVVELKVDAGDQKRQLKRYENYVLENWYEDHRIIYLTLDGKVPSEHSCKDMKKPEKLLYRSFREHLLEWLEKCIETCRTYDVEASFIQQYRTLIKKLVEEESMEQDIVQLVKTSKELKACLGLVDALSVIKGQILYDFMDKIYKELKKKKCKFLYDDYECAKDYYDGNAYYPSFGCEITNFTSRNKNVILALVVYVDTDGLQFYIGYFNEEIECINNDQFKKGNKRINQRVEDAITNTLNSKIRNNRYNCIIYQYIVDNANQKYDFKHFGENCAELKDSSVLKSEANRISRNLMYYMKEIKTLLEEPEENSP